MKHRGYGVVIASRVLPTKRIRVTKSNLRAPAPVALAVRFSPTYKLTHVATLPAPMSIRFTLARRVPSGFVLYAVTRDGRAPWRVIPATVSGKGRYATVRVSHLSLFSFFGVDAAALLREVKQGVIDGLLGGATAEASPPRCANEHAARSNGYAIQSTNGSTVYWCFGIENNERVLKVVNNRRYALLVAHPGLSVISPGSFHLEAATLARIGSGNRTVLAPRDEAVFKADLAAGGRAGITTDFDGLSQSLFQLQFGVDTAVSIATKLKIFKGTAIDVFKTFLDLRSCASAIGGTGGEIIQKCFTPSQIIKAFGFKGLLLAPLMIAGPFLAFFRSEFNSLGDQLNGRSHYAILVRHNAPPTAPTTTAIPTTTGVAPTATAAPTTTATPPSSGDFSVGAPFRDRCTVAWPTAPTVTSTQIQMTMECPHVPESQFLLTVVIYDDPNLPVSPSHATMDVVGKVVDVAMSGYGFKELVVHADQITLTS